MIPINLKLLTDFAKKHPNSKKSLVIWKLVIENAHWKNKQDVLRDFPKAKMIKNNRARFEITHNTFRLIAHIDYEDKLVEIRFIGTHNEYEKIDPERI